MMVLNRRGLPHLEQGGRNLFDICVLSVISAVISLAPRGAANNPLSFCGPSALRISYAKQVSRISEIASFFHCLGSLGTMRHRAGLF
jgi:hypothetical protein